MFVVVIGLLIVIQERIFRSEGMPDEEKPLRIDIANYVGAVMGYGFLVFVVVSLVLYRKLCSLRKRIEEVEQRMRHLTERNQ